MSGNGPWELAGLAAGLIVVSFALLWLVELRTNDASLVDVGWAAALGALAALYGLLATGAPYRRLALAVLMGAWSTRLASHIYRRHRGGPEDDRYRAIRERWGARAHTFFFFFYQAQGALALVLSIPFLLIAFNPAPAFEPMELAGFVLGAVGIAGESVADRQLARHRRDPANRGKTCRVGLWRYSRHPNYFFEWLVWCAVALAALPAPGGWLGLVSPALMLLFILKITGIPPTEERALESRGDDYRAYQRSTSAFVPWFPKKESTT
jgi:steroid 5-alpha reductase family enzyme